MKEMTRSCERSISPWLTFKSCSALVLCAFAMPSYAADSKVDAEPKVKPEPLTNPGDWVTDEDYPVEARSKSIAGVTGFALTVAADGRVSNCLITMSSGSEILDETTCTLLQQRGRFRPALDRKNRPVAAKWTSKIHWQMPENFIPQYASAYPKRLRYVLDIDEEGTIENCSVIESIGAPTFSPQLGREVNPCEKYLQNKEGRAPILDGQGRGMKARIEMLSEALITPR